MSQVRSKWHTFKESFLQRQLIYIAPPGSTGKYCDDFGMDEKAFVKFIEGCENAPKFVFSEALNTIARDEKQFRALLDMKEAGVLRLPYPVMLVEIPYTSTNGKGHFIVLLFDPKATDETDPEFAEYDVGGVSMSTHKDPNGEYGCMSPCISLLALEELEGSVEPNVKMTASAGDWFPRRDMESTHYMNAVFQKASESVGAAWFYTMLLMQTQGVESEVIDVERLNKKREASGKMPISNHTYIRIGHVYRKDGTRERFDSRKSPIPHWRRGHIRNVRVGKGRKETKKQWIKPMLVASKSDADVFKVPDYFVKE